MGLGMKKACGVQALGFCGLCFCVVSLIFVLGGRGLGLGL